VTIVDLVTYQPVAAAIVRTPTGTVIARGTDDGTSARGPIPTGAIAGILRARYSHVTAGIRRELMDGLEEMWQTTAGKCPRMHLRSPVKYLVELLQDSPLIVACPSTWPVAAIRPTHNGCTSILEAAR
jgi:hypothetical protein